MLELLLVEEFKYFLNCWSLSTGNKADLRNTAISDCLLIAREIVRNGHLQIFEQRLSKQAFKKKQQNPWEKVFSCKQ